MLASSPGSLSGPRGVALVQPDIQPWRFPVVRFAHDVQPAIAIQVAHLGFVGPDPLAEKRPGKITSTVAAEDIQVAVTVEIGDLKAVTVDHVVAQEVVTRPGLVRAVAGFPLVPLQTSHTVADHKYHLGS